LLLLDPSTWRRKPIHLTFNITQGIYKSRYITLQISRLGLYFLTYCYDENLYIITFVYAHGRPIHVYTHLRIYSTQTCLHTSTVIYAVYMFTYYRAHILIYDNLLLRPYTGTSLEAYTPIHVYIFIRRYTYTCLHVCSHRLQINLHTSTAI